MPLVCNENPESTRYTQDINGEILIRTYTITGTANAWLAAGVLPSLFQADPWGLDMEVKRIECWPGVDRDPVNGPCYARVEYGTNLIPQWLDKEREFDITTQTQHVMAALEDNDNLPVTATTGRVIGEKAPGEKPEGVDLLSSHFVFSIRVTVDESWFTTCFGSFDNYVEILRDATGTINRWPWRQFYEREALFIGCTGRYIFQQRWELTYRFAAQYSLNVNTSLVGPISRPVLAITLMDGSTVYPWKYGWDYLWYKFGEKTVAGQIVTGIISTHVSRVYRELDWSVLGIGL